MAFNIQLIYIYTTIEKYLKIYIENGINMTYFVLYIHTNFNVYIIGTYLNITI